MLADLGAEVIKIEERERGDPGRGITAVAGSGHGKLGRNFYFEANNKHKKSIALNLKQAGAREIVYRLAAKSDVFVQNFRKGVAQAAGLGYADLRGAQSADHLCERVRLRPRRAPTAASPRSTTWDRRAPES